MTLRVVLDTHILLYAWVFQQGRLAWVRQAWQTGRIVPIVCRETVAEWPRVLAYPKFKLATEDRRELIADFLPWADTAVLPGDPPDLPGCRDSDDQVFPGLASTAGVDFLVTGDSDWLAPRANFLPPILTADELKRRLPTFDGCVYPLHQRNRSHSMLASTVMGIPVAGGEDASAAVACRSGGLVATERTVYRETMVYLRFLPLLIAPKALFWVIVVTTIIHVIIEFDLDKRTRTLRERGLDFALAAEIFAGRHFTSEDTRDDYSEPSYITVGKLHGRMVVMVWTPRGAARRIISMRKANEREQARYAHRVD